MLFNQQFQLLRQTAFLFSRDLSELVEHWPAHGDRCAFSHISGSLILVGCGWMYHQAKFSARKKVKNVALYHGWIYSLLMNPPKKPKQTRHGMLAEGTSQTSVTMKKEIMEKARAAAKADGRSLSNWLEQVARKALEGGRLLLFMTVVFAASLPPSRPSRPFSPGVTAGVPVAA